MRNHAQIAERLPVTLAKQAPTPIAWREAYDVGQAARLHTAIYRRADLVTGDAFSGPAIVAEDATSTVIGPGFGALIAMDGTIVITRRGEA